MNKQVLRRLDLIDTPARKARVRGRGASGVEANINITPLVDVVLVLLIIFMVVTPLLDDGITLPMAKDPAKIETMKDDLNVRLKLDGSLLIDKEAVPAKKIEVRLAAELGKNPLRQVYVMADRSLAFSDVRKILKMLRDSGAKHAGLVSNAIEGEG